MTFAQLLTVFSPEHYFFSIFIWFVLLTTFFYLARLPIHLAIRSICQILHQAFRLSARAVKHGVSRLRARNREVLLEYGRLTLERTIEREFSRVESVIKRDLDAYPALHRRLSERINLLDEEYRQSMEEPPTPPAWADAVKSVAQIPASGDSLVAEILEDMQKSFEKAQHAALDEYKQSSRSRHLILKKMMPHWRDLAKDLDKVGKAVKDVNLRSKSIDQYLVEYQKLNSDEARAERILSHSAFAQFAMSLFVIVIAMGGALVNFNLIAYPMQEMVGGNSYIGPLKTADISALVIIFFEVVMGLLLMEALRITNLLPQLGALEDRLRIPMIWFFFGTLFVFASVESSLAYMRDLIAADKEAFIQSLGTLGATPSQGRWIPTAGQMVLGFILPFALAFVAIPLESFVKTFRTVLGYGLIGFLLTLAYLLRLCGNFFKVMGKVSIHLYDVLVFGPLWVERMVIERKKQPIGKKDNPRSVKST